MERFTKIFTRNYKNKPKSAYRFFFTLKLIKRVSNIQELFIVVIEIQSNEQVLITTYLLSTIRMA